MIKIWIVSILQFYLQDNSTENKVLPHTVQKAELKN